MSTIIAKAIILVVVGQTPSDSIVSNQAGVFPTEEACQVAFENFKVAAREAQLDTSRFRGVCYRSPFEYHFPGPKAQRQQNFIMQQPSGEYEL